MSITSFRSTEPLYTIFVRNNQAETQLKSWIKDNRIEHATVVGNRMHLHHQQAFEHFLITWPHGWDCLTVWDVWRKHHIYLD